MKNEKEIILNFNKNKKRLTEDEVQIIEEAVEVIAKKDKTSLERGLVSLVSHYLLIRSDEDFSDRNKELLDSIRDVLYTLSFTKANKNKNSIDLSLGVPELQRNLELERAMLEESLIEKELRKNLLSDLNRVSDRFSKTAKILKTTSEMLEGGFLSEEIALDILTFQMSSVTD